MKFPRYHPSEILFYDVVMSVFRSLTDLFGELEIKGLERIPAEGGALIVANHLSYFDPIALGGILDRSGRNTKALAKSELFTNPFMRWLLTNLGQVPVYRGTEKASEALSLAEEFLRKGDTIAIYPEGTIPADGLLKPFKTGAARLAMKTGVPVIPIVQAGANQIIPSDVKNIFRTAGKAMFAQPCLRVLVGEPLYLIGDYQNREEVLSQNALLENTMKKLLEELAQEMWRPQKTVASALREKKNFILTSVSLYAKNFKKQPAV